MRQPGPRLRRRRVVPVVATAAALATATLALTAVTAPPADVRPVVPDAVADVRTAAAPTPDRPGVGVPMPLRPTAAETARGPEPNAAAVPRR